MMQPNFVAGYIVDVNKNEPLYLLLRRAQHVHLPGIWQIVTGKLTSEEPAGEAVRREIFEETGLSCSKIYNVDVTMFFEQFKNGIAFSANFCAFAKQSDPVKLSKKEHDKFQWSSFQDACSLLAFPAQIQTLEFIHNHYVLREPHDANLLQVKSNAG